MSDFAFGVMFGFLVLIGIVAIVRVLRATADDRLRQKRYADEWVRRHRESRQP